MTFSPRPPIRSALVINDATAGGNWRPERFSGIASQVTLVEDISAAVERLRREPSDLVIIPESADPQAVAGFVQIALSEFPATSVVVACDHQAAEAGSPAGGPVALEPAAAPAMTAIGYFSDECPPEIPIVGRSEGAVGAMRMIRLVALSRCNPILIQGETGTGKELAARAAHYWRYGETCPFIAVNCATLSATLLESELYGHVRGAFTGADRDKTGLFELADGGTIFLDEISEMPLELQAKLLRVLQERSFRKVGGTKDIAFGGTVIASTNRVLVQEALKGAFRRDLYYRLAVVPITIPPLRAGDRRGDIPLLARYFLAAAAHPGRPQTLTPAAERRLMEYDWPGNVRELRNVIDRAVILNPSGEVTAESLMFDGAEPCLPPPVPLPAPASYVEPAAAPPPAPAEEGMCFSLKSAERELIVRALKETGWKRAQAATLLGITRATLYAKLKRYKIAAPASDDPADAVAEEIPEELQDGVAAV